MNSARRPSPRRAEPSFVLYVEGPRDRDILCAWASRVSPSLTRAIVRGSVILGGRQPLRAARHLETLRTDAAEARGLCLFDHDGEPVQVPSEAELPWLDFFTWSRRHIESYLLVPAALRRSVRRRGDDARMDRFIREHLADLADESAFRAFDAKRLFAREGELSRALGRPLQPGRIARAMHAGDFHPDVHDLLERLRQGFGIG
jgi:hypothetical protein